MKYTHNKIVTTEGLNFSYLVDAFVSSLENSYRGKEEIKEMIDMSYYIALDRIDIDDLHHEILESVLKDKRVICVDGYNYCLKNVEYCKHGINRSLDTCEQCEEINI